MKLKDPNSHLASVDAYFESTIKQKGILNEYTAVFRGRPLRGKKFEIVNQDPSKKLKMNYYEINKVKSGGKITNEINQSGEINVYYIWKFDEDIPEGNTFLNLGNIYHKELNFEITANNK